MWVCTGKELTHEGKAVIGFIPIVDDDGTLAEKRHRFDAKGLSVIVGGVYLVQTNGESLLPGRMEWQRTYEFTNLVAVWQTLARAADLELRRQSQEKGAGKINHLLEVLEPLREAYHSTDWRTQKAVELIVLDYLRRPLPRDKQK
jgi:hypothetical protein